MQEPGRGLPSGRAATPVLEEEPAQSGPEDSRRQGGVWIIDTGNSQGRAPESPLFDHFDFAGLPQSPQEFGKAFRVAPEPGSELRVGHICQVRAGDEGMSEIDKALKQLSEEAVPAQLAALQDRVLQRVACQLQTGSSRPTSRMPTSW